jgi:hypothetical protein
LDHVKACHCVDCRLRIAKRLLAFGILTAGLVLGLLLLK